MENQNTEAHDLIIQARDALRRGDKDTAHKLGEQAALLSPGMEDAWLILTATDPNPEDALAYAQQALEIDPSSARALKAVEWAIARLRQSQAAPVPGEAAVAAPVTPVKAPPEQGKATEPRRKSDNRALIYAAVFLAILLCFVIIYAAYTGITQPALASILSNVSGAPTQEELWAPMDLARGSATPAAESAQIQQAADTPTQMPASVAPAETTVTVPTETSTLSPTETPASLSTELPAEGPATEPSASTIAEIPTDATTVPEPTATPGVIFMQIVEDTPASQSSVPPASSPVQLPEVASTGDGVRWIDVDLTNQRVYAYEGDTVVNSFIVSTGTWRTPTVTGQYKVYVKYRAAPMSGPGYYLPNVPYIMYFYKGYGLHGTYWHNNFGTPMSHGCVNLRTDEAAWLYSWASVGTLVNVHY